MTQGMADRRDYPDEDVLAWTPRQEQVLRLLARGRSNPEIAAELGIGLEGAKHHVREIMSKLDVGSREGAAEYWRWRQGMGQRIARRMRGLVGLGALRIGTAGAGAIVLGLAAFAIVGGGDDGTFEAFHLAFDVGDPDSDEAGLSFQWWLVDETTWRVEVEEWGAGESSLTVHGANSEVLWTYESGRNGLQVYRPAAADLEVVLNVPAFELPSFFSWPGPAKHQVVEELLGEREANGLTVLAVEEEVRDGHRVVRVDTQHADHDPPIELRTWVDRERSIIVEQRMPSGDDARSPASFEPRMELAADFFDPPAEGSAGGVPEPICSRTNGWEAGPAREGWMREEFLETAWSRVPPGYESMRRIEGWEIVRVGTTLECVAPADIPLVNRSLHRLFFPATRYTLTLTDEPAAFQTPEEDTVVTVVQQFVESEEERPVPDDSVAVRIGDHEGWGRADEQWTQVGWEAGDVMIGAAGRGLSLDELIKLLEELFAE